MRLTERVKNALIRFMYGRNGVDQLNLCLIWLVIVLHLAGLLTGGTAGSLIGSAGTVAAVWVIFRVFSRNLPRRRAENAAFCAACGILCRALYAGRATAFATGSTGILPAPPAAPSAGCPAEKDVS